jgi:predicted  nucleic acid-binding Zn-ribbon protein
LFELDAAHDFQEVATLAQLLTLIQDNHNTVIGRMDHLDDRLNGIDERLNGIDERLNGIDGRLNRINNRLEEHAAYVKNTRIINKNRSQPTIPPTPLVKIVSNDIPSYLHTSR